MRPIVPIEIRSSTSHAELLSNFLRYVDHQTQIVFDQRASRLRILFCQPLRQFSLLFRRERRREHIASSYVKNAFAVIIRPGASSRQAVDQFPEAKFEFRRRQPDTLRDFL